MLLIKLFTAYKGIDFTQKIKVAPKIQYLLFYIFLYYLSKIILKHMESIYIFKKKDMIPLTSLLWTGFLEDNFSGPRHGFLDT